MTATPHPKKPRHRYGVAPNVFEVAIATEALVVIHQAVKQAIAYQWSVRRLIDTLASMPALGFPDPARREDAR